MNNLLEKGKEIVKKIKDKVIKIGVKKVAIGGAIVIVGITSIAFLGSKGGNGIALANVIHPTSADYPYYTYNEVKNFSKVSISGSKLKLKENKVNNNNTRSGDVEFEFTIKNTAKETINNIGYTIFLKDMDGRPFAIRGSETYTLKAGEKTKVKVDHIWSNDTIKTNTQLLLIDNYNYDYPILNVYELISTNSDGTIITKEL